MKIVSRIFTGIIFVFLFAPIVVLLLFSFNASKSTAVFDGFSLYWYRELFHNSEALGALLNTLILAVCATVISTVLGTAAAVGIQKIRSRWYKSALNTVTNIPITNPDIITGISLMLMFVFVGSLFGESMTVNLGIILIALIILLIPDLLLAGGLICLVIYYGPLVVDMDCLNFGTMLIAHITFCTPYVILEVLPKLQQMDPALPEAAMDLGCPPLRAFFKVVIPEIRTGIVTGAIMAFTLSLDDFVISYFTTGTGFQTLPIYIYSMTKKKVTPDMYALAAIIFAVSLTLLLVSNIVSNDESRQLHEHRYQKRMAKRHAKAEAERAAKAAKQQ